MKSLNYFELKEKYMPVFPRASGKPTIYIEGYPYEDDEPMSATGFHGIQIMTLSDQLTRRFYMNDFVYIGIDSFIYYVEDDRTKFVGPDIYVVLGAKKFPERRSFYTWAEGATPAAVFEFLSDSTAAIDRGEKVRKYIVDIGVQEYFIHQPEMDKPPEFGGWRKGPSGEIDEIVPDDQGGLFSRALNLWLRWADIPESKVRLLRPYFPDGTPITTSIEEQQLLSETKAIAEQEAERRRDAEFATRRAERIAQQESQRRQQAERIIQEETERRRDAELEVQRAEAVAQQEAQRRHEMEAELEQLRAQLAAQQDDESK